MSPFVAFGVMTALLAAAPVMAADKRADAMTMADAVVVEVGPDVARSPQISAPRFSFAENRRETRPSILSSLYVTSAALQAWDVYSTMTALRMGAVESNPLMQTAVKNPAVFIALKSSVTMASIFASERLWKEHHRVAAVALMVASNGLMAAVAANNSAVLSRLR